MVAFWSTEVSYCFSCYLVERAVMQHSRPPLLVTVAGPCHVPFVRHATKSQSETNPSSVALAESLSLFILITCCISCQVLLSGPDEVSYSVLAFLVRVASLSHIPSVWHATKSQSETNLSSVALAETLSLSF